ncbi:hypothetical protein V8C42DRAFT_313138 [Trichoderma barbatum]
MTPALVIFFISFVSLYFGVYSFLPFYSPPPFVGILFFFFTPLSNGGFAEKRILSFRGFVE